MVLDQITLALSSLLQTLACHQQTRDRRFSADTLAAALACHQQTQQFDSSQLTLALCSPFEEFTAPQRLLAYVGCLVLSLSCFKPISHHCLMQSSSLNANQALNRMYRANTY